MKRMGESEKHKRLKEKAAEWLQEEHGFSADEVEKEYQIDGGDSYYLIDVVGVNEEKKVAVECGKLTGRGDYRETRREAIDDWCDEFKRFSYIYAKADDLRQAEISDTTTIAFPAKAVESVREYGLTPENAAKFVLLSPAYNRKELAEEMEISVDTAHRYRRAFQEMDIMERASIIGALAIDKYDEIVDRHVGGAFQ